MTGPEVHAIRTQLGLSQVQLAQLLGVHPLTVSKWERSVLAPTPHQAALLDSFGKAGKAKQQIGSEVSNLLVTAGVAMALLALLSAAFDKK
ncbi:helix-turn-helix domain-containing protein [Longimicrobium sp.]|uniref:helix-turn-helix domain-containing protein n=1 Tax=Longimicrobium sp. TaxID=2029185 RepID=UPI002E311DDD|nr:helix-turn-helix domain-containing protein [Longimicrobium sp.]HEX6039313.1 helix-turn-helix domain-containing protein [Longimicrobium sp.]